MLTLFMDDRAHEEIDQIEEEAISHDEIYSALQSFARNSCKTRPGWSGKISDLTTSSIDFTKIRRNTLISLIHNLNKSKRILGFEFFYQEHDESLLIISQTNTGNWRTLSQYFKDHQSYLKLFSSKQNRKIFSHWQNDKFTIERLYFESEPLGYPALILPLDISGFSCNAFRLKFNGGQSIDYIPHSFELEESFFNISQLLGFYELPKPIIFTNSDYTWFSPRINSEIHSNEHTIYNYGLIYSLIYTFESSFDLIQLITNIKDSPFYSSINIFSLNTKKRTNISLIPNDSQIELFIDGFTSGYRRILSFKYSNEKLDSYSKLIPSQYLKKLVNQASDTPVYPSVPLLNEEDLSDQIGLIRGKYSISSD